MIMNDRPGAKCPAEKLRGELPVRLQSFIVSVCLFSVGQSCERNGKTEKHE